MRTHTCGSLRKDDDGKSVILCGFVHKRRDHGGLVFIDLRDRYGVTQIVFDPEKGAQAHEIAHKLRSEFVVKVTGNVVARPDNMVNKNLDTGEIEIYATDLQIFSESQTPPFEIDADNLANEELRLKHRYLDLRRQKMKSNIITRHKVIKYMRDFLDSQDFLEIETPILIKGTPEGSREYIVPSRVYPGNFYVLPQSPQQLKQLLMVAGMDKYFQIARCFRDEDQRGDRQPEFTQLDMELSFVSQEDIIKINSDLLFDILTKFRPDLSVKDNQVFRLTYDEAMNRFGSDKPDLRFDLEFKDATNIFENTNFNAFAGVLKAGGVLKVMKVPGAADKLSRKDISELESVAKIYKAKGLAYVSKKDGELNSPILKFLTETEIEALLDLTDFNEGDIMFFACDTFDIACNSLGHVRNAVAKKLNLIDESICSIGWVTDFPMFEVNDDGSMQACHHPFTSPKKKDVEYMHSDIFKVRTNSYDLVMNGYEIAGGSVRIHERDLQAKVFDLLGISKEDAKERFGHILTAFSYGVPPHAGIAWGLDRLIMLLCNEPNIREVIAFPKDQKAKDVMLGAPSLMPNETLDELSISIDTE